MLRCWVIDKHVERFVSLADLSTQGARVLTATPPSVGERVELRFDLPSSVETLIAKGRVVWRAEGFRGRGGVMGLAFDSVSAASDLESFIGNAAGSPKR